MENMPPGNSFPQICVVSVNKIVVIGGNPQEYLRVVAFSNHMCLLFNYVLSAALTQLNGHFAHFSPTSDPAVTSTA
jgi:hypothetical protein